MVETRIVASTKDVMNHRILWNNAHIGEVDKEQPWRCGSPAVPICCIMSTRAQSFCKTIRDFWNARAVVRSGCCRVNLHVIRPNPLNLCNKYGIQHDSDHRWSVFLSPICMHLLRISQSAICNMIYCSGLRHLLWENLELRWIGFWAWKWWAFLTSTQLGWCGVYLTNQSV